MSDLVRNPKAWFARVGAQMVIVVSNCTDTEKGKRLDILHVGSKNVVLSFSNCISNVLYMCFS